MSFADSKPTLIMGNKNRPYRNVFIEIFQCVNSYLAILASFMT
ncbi:hypothetical protein C3B79_0902 [Aeromonas hydrophila]|nr:hypothetical protein C3B79_0902 [Aeromonas hydrophila]